MTTTVRTHRIDVPEALWRVEVMQEIESDGGTLDARQLDILATAVAVIAADSSFRNATPAEATPTVFVASNGNSGTGGGAIVRKLSEKQLGCLRREIPRRDAAGLAVTTVAEMLARCGRDGTDPLTVIPARLASDALGILFAAGFLPRVATVPAATAPVQPATPAAAAVGTAARTDAPAVTEAGAYRTAAGDVYRVQASRETGRLYAKRLDPMTGKFDYVKGSIYTLSAAMRMTLEQAAEFGRESARAAKEAGRPYGWCVYGHKLTHPDSIAAGIGPICAGKV